ncbi:MAG: TadE/TadG family type IV pilus assembly protein [Roseiflexaceae bacterium]
MVEFALAATLIFLLLSATVDIGLIFFTLQGLHNAAQEGGTYGSRWLTSGSQLDIDGIRDRARHEAGTTGIGFANLLDLNADGIADVSSGGVKQINPKTGNPVINDYIQILSLYDADADGDPFNDGTAPNYTACPNLSDIQIHCHIVVTVSSEYRFLFPLAPAFGDQVRLNSRYIMPMREH